MTRRAIRTAVIGFGMSGRVFHAPFLRCDPSYALTVVVTSNADRAAQARAHCPGVTVLAGPDELFARADKLDLVVISTPPQTHFELATSALDLGLHVVVDKPFVPSSAQATALIDQAQRVGRILTVFQNRRWDADFRTLRRIIADGKLGEIHTFESRFERWRPDGFRRWKARTAVADGGGVLFDLGTHLIDQAIQLFGEVEHMWADITRHTPATSADDDTLMVLRHRNGTRSCLHMSGLAALPGPRFHVLGSRGAYTKWNLDGQEHMLNAGVLPSDENYGLEPEQNWGILGTGSHTRRVEPDRGAYGQFYRRLAHACAGDGPLPVDPHDAVETLRLIEQAHGLEPHAPSRRREE